MVNALVLSGGRIEADRFPQLSWQVETKAEAPILGRPLVDWCVEAVCASARIDRIAVVGPRRLAGCLPTRPGLILVPEQGQIAGNLAAGLEALGSGCRVLVLSGDLPLLTPRAIEDLLANTPDADCVYAYVSREAALGEFPERDWVFARTLEGAFTGSGVGLLWPDIVRRNWQWVERLLAARRESVLRLAGIVGPSLALRYACGRLRVADVERRLSWALRLKARGYCSAFPEVALDVDREADIGYVEKVLRGRLEGGGVWG